MRYSEQAARNVSSAYRHIVMTALATAEIDSYAPTENIIFSDYTHSSHGNQTKNKMFRISKCFSVMMFDKTQAINDVVVRAF